MSFKNVFDVWGETEDKTALLSLVAHEKSTFLRLKKALRNNPPHKNQLILEIPVHSLLGSEFSHFQILACGHHLVLEQKKLLQPHLDTFLVPLKGTSVALLLQIPQTNFVAGYFQKYGAALLCLWVLAHSLGFLMLFWGKYTARKMFQAIKEETAHFHAAKMSAEKALSFTPAENATLVAIKSAYEQEIDGQFLLFKALTERFRSWSERMCQTAIHLSQEHAQKLGYPSSTSELVIEHYQLFGAPQPTLFNLQDIFDRLLKLFAPSITEKSLTIQQNYKASQGRLHSDPLIVTVIFANILLSRLPCLPQSSVLKISLQREELCVRMRLSDQGYTSYEGTPFHITHQKAFFTLPPDALHTLSRAVGITFSFPASKEGTHVLLIELPLTFEAAEEIPLPGNVLPFPRAR